MTKMSKKIVTVTTAAVLIGTSFFLASIPSDTLMSFIGAENVYIFMYLLALVGSLSTFASVPYPLILISLASAGASPLALGLVSALGVITSDSITYFAAKSGRGLLGESMKGSVELLATRIARYPRLLTPGLILYGSVSPLSNDFAVLSLSFMNYKYYRVVLPLAVGNLIFNLGMALLGVYAYEWILGFF